MRVAVLLSGQFRNSYKEYETIKKNLIDKYNADVFIYYTPSAEIDFNPTRLINLYNPKKYILRINLQQNQERRFPLKLAKEKGFQCFLINDIIKYGDE